MELTIAICTVTERVNSFMPVVVTKLHKQALLFKNVEILYLGDNKKRPTGTKRNDLANLAQGKYIVYVDDDDDISDNYVAYLIEAAKTGCDCLCFKAKYYVDGKYRGIVDYSLEHKKDSNYKGLYNRIPNHITAIKTELVRRVKFKDMFVGEDADFAVRLYPKLKNEAVINETLYFYNYNTKTTLTK